jgi:hypothetical protein
MNTAPEQHTQNSPNHVEQKQSVTHPQQMMIHSLPPFNPYQTYGITDQNQFAQIVQAVIAVLQQSGLLNNDNQPTTQQTTTKPKKKPVVRKDTPRNRFVSEYMNDEKHKEENDYVHSRLMKSAGETWAQMDATEKYRKYGVLNEFPKGVTEYNMFIRQKTKQIKNDLTTKKNGVEPTREETRAELSNEWIKYKNTPELFAQLQIDTSNENTKRREIRDKIKQQNDVIKAQVDKEKETEQKKNENEEQLHKEELKLKEIEELKERQKRIVYPKYGLGGKTMTTSHVAEKPKVGQTILFKKTKQRSTTHTQPPTKHQSPVDCVTTTNDIVLTDMNDEEAQFLEQLEQSDQVQSDENNENGIIPLSEDELRDLVESSMSIDDGDDPFGDNSQFEFEEEFM